MIDALGQWVVQTGISVSLLIVFVLIIRRPMARIFGANAAYALWSLPLIRLCLPTLKILPGEQSAADVILNELPVTFALPEEATSILVSPTLQTPSNMVVDAGVPGWIGVLLAFWMGVAMFWLAWQLLRQSHFMHSLQFNSDMAPRPIQMRADAIQSDLGLKKPVPVRIAHDGRGPFVTGVMRPIIVLPEGFEADYTVEQQDFALLHELSHVKRGDLWVAMLGLVFRAINWPNPLVHYAAHRLRIDQEAACDAFVLSKTTHPTAKASYAGTLIHAAQSLGQNPETPLGLALAPNSKPQNSNSSDAVNKEADHV